MTPKQLDVQRAQIEACLDAIEGHHPAQRHIPLLVERTDDGAGELFFVHDQSFVHCTLMSGQRYVSSARAKSEYLALEVNYANYPSRAQARSNGLCGRILLNQLRGLIDNKELCGVICHRETEVWYRVAHFSVGLTSAAGAARHLTRGGIACVVLTMA